VPGRPECVAAGLRNDPGRLLVAYVGWGMQIAFAPEDFATDNPKVKIRKPKGRKSWCGGGSTVCLRIVQKLASWPKNVARTPIGSDFSRSERS
jgi:hypothetical protein